MHTLFPHQQQALAYARPRRAIALFMEMRLGKCTVVIRWAQSHGLRRVLVIAPLSTLAGRQNWEGELGRDGVPAINLTTLDKRVWEEQWYTWAPAIAPALVDDGFSRPGDTTRGLRRRRRRGWFLTNYEAVLHRPELLAHPWDGIVIDESTRIRNPKAQLTKLLLRETEHIPYRALLSGLPNPEDPADYFTQFQFLHGAFMGMDNFWAWRQRYFHQGYAKWDWIPNPKAYDEIKAYVQQHSFTLLRKTAGVGSEKFRTSVRVNLTKAQRAVLQELKRDFAVGERETKWMTVVHAWMQRVAGGWHPTARPFQLLSNRKLKALSKLCVSGQPTVVWFRFNHEIESAYAYLQKHRPQLRVAYVHGAMPDHRTVRVSRQEEFQAGQLDVILLQVKLGRYGWNLSRANLAIYYSNTYEFEDRSQSEDRIIHLTKRDPCTYVDLVTVGTLDEDVVEALAEKRITSRIFARRMNDALRRFVQRVA